MGNEDKIKESGDLISKGKSIFLPKEFQDPEGRPEAYSLVDEFAVTRKNRHILFNLSIFGFIAVVVISAIMFTMYIQKKQRRISISISEFEDINLMEVLDKSKKYENDLSKARNELEDLRLAMQEGIHKAGDAGEREGVRNKYQSRIREKSEEISSIRKKMTEYDAKVRDNAVKAEAIVANYKKLHKLKMNEQRDYYDNKIRALILKYNPYYRDNALKRIIRGKSSVSKNWPVLIDYKPELSREGVISKQEFKRLRQRVKNNSLLLSRMLKIPYINSVNPSIKKMDYMWRISVHDYERIWSALAVAVSRKNALIRNYQYAFDHLSKMNPESGYIIDARNLKNIRVSLNRIVSVKDGDRGLVFRTDDDYIGKIEFFKSPYGIRARKIEIQPTKVIQPFDKILIKIKKSDVGE